jgi:hypothetical protein
VAPTHQSSEQDAGELRSAPTPDELAREAYAIYLARGAQHGHDLDDWFEAERRLSAGPQTRLHQHDAAALGVSSAIAATGIDAPRWADTVEPV